MQIKKKKKTVENASFQSVLIKRKNEKVDTDAGTDRRCMQRVVAHLRNPAVISSEAAADTPDSHIAG